MLVPTAVSEELKQTHRIVLHILDQTWANYDPRARCGPPTLVDTSMYCQTSVFERLAVQEGDDRFFFGVHHVRYKVNLMRSRIT